jgi:nucleotide-binding universal stress UspA family protein
MSTGGSDYTSILDKTDWRRTIHKALEEAVLSIGREEEFYYNVEQAIEAIKANYPNWDASTEIDAGVKKIKDRHNQNAQDWIDAHKMQWAYPWVKNYMLLKWKDAFYREILQFLKDVAGKHRMLLWGIKSVPEGSMGVDEDATGNESNP